jgi:hypothetical protein
MELKQCKTKIVLQLKELGFPVTYAKGYWSKQYWSNTKWDNTYKKKIIKSTQALVVKWFRDIHDIHIEVNIRHNPLRNIYKKYAYAISIESDLYDGLDNNLDEWIGVGMTDNKKNLDYHVCNTYELAEEAGIIEAIKLLKARFRNDKER